MDSVKSGDQREISAVPQADPRKQAGIAGAVGKENKIFVLAHRRPAFCIAKIPEVDVAHRRKIQVQNMGAIVSKVPQLNGQLKWKLVVD